MNPLLRCSFVAALTLAATVASSSARPIDFREISLLVRARQSEPSITSEISSRKLLHKFTPEQETKLRSEGASESLIQSLRNATVVPESDAPPAEQNRDPRPGSNRRPHDEVSLAQGNRNDIRVFDVAYEHPINLSRWGGSDSEFVFHRLERFDPAERQVEMIDPIRSYVHSSTYLGTTHGGSTGDEQNFTSATAHAFARPVSVDASNPVRVPGVRYLLYPVYASRGVSLYYIGAASADSVRIAVGR